MTTPNPEQPRQPNLPRTISEDWSDYSDWLESMKGRDLFGLSTGIPSVDKATRGLRGLVVINGRPGSGKTSLCLQWTMDMAEKEGLPLLYVLTEMNSFLLYNKTLSRLAKLDDRDILNRVPGHESAIGEAEARLRKFWDRVIIADARCLRGRQFNLQDVQGWVWATTQKFQKPPIVVIDHVQNIQPLAPTSALKERMDLVAAGLASLSSYYSTTVIAISEKNRGSYYDASMESSMGSASWEYSADILMTLMGENDQKGREAAGDASEPERLVDLVIVKNRLASIGKVRLKFYSAISWFSMP